MDLLRKLFHREDGGYEWVPTREPAQDLLRECEISVQEYKEHSIKVIQTLPEIYIARDKVERAVRALQTGM